MSQVKKIEVERAILDSADALFREEGYSRTTMAAIARRAGIATSTIYVYFRSKVEVFFSVYTPWLEGRLSAMEAAAARVSDPVARARVVLDWMWIRIPTEDNYFSNELIAAVSTATRADNYSQDLFLRTRRRIAAAMTGQEEGALSGRAIDIAMVTLMAYDGFSLKIRTETSPTSPALIDHLAAIFAAALAAEAVPA
ncbi:TetR/AcrR family transcriptional regulator [Ruixingdingia sedimenti]|uniref:TetR/AcrR family transcriptional regulator n=1 Tax=Ruixingdingia sedimenti TaxID=3073604 RepID=A0ABU1FCJ1_9RHOB|nr:TetR/AcrR family transcriptional regulator [Xinfangfangia sp. LG-4]MDR5654580.1 TetR/AcrR family transcriptional regulator [Xinfangfangia sp. LG-4]